MGVAVAGTPVGLAVQDLAALDGLLDSPDLWTPTELVALQQTEPPDRLRTAARWWTAKEAVLKSVGRGLIDPVESLEACRSPAPWHGLEVADGHSAAIAGAEPRRVVHLSRVHDPIVA